MTTLHATIDRTDAHSPTTWADIPGFSTVESIAGTGSVVLLIALIPIRSTTGSDRTMEFRFTIDGSATNSPIVVAFADDVDETAGAHIVWAVDGLSTGNHTFAVQAQDVKNSSEIGVRTRSFQVIEFDADASILIDTQSTAANTSTGTFANMTGLSASVTPASGSLLLFLFNATPDLSSVGDKAAEFRFILDGTQDGPYSICALDNVDEGGSVAMMWAETGHAATSQTIAVQWRTVQAALPMDTTRNRTFQVIEITANFNLSTDLLLTSDQTAPATYADMTGMTGTLTPDSTDSVVLWMGCGNPLPRGADDKAQTRLADGGTREGAELLTWLDNITLVYGFLLVRAKTGLSGSHTLSFQWEDVGGGTTTDTGRERSFQICSFDAAVAAAPVFRRRQRTTVRL